ncbi:hypothetical protein C7999DRAFT_44216 [Corynascus novoguineensis]|uniref:Uncharacterized protein n=1 Tax=Corynascus novoguineensis TaxID=1126955 RepID=A0AAN7CL48_9PEZI|nr:hypothetical protein C7999DRAFT_44216 [Corynascus novoguineensis]
MTGNSDTFRRGATGFRNAGDLAQRHRDGFTQEANARARQSNTEPHPEAEITTAMAEQYEESTDEFVDCEDYPGSQAVGAEDYAAPGDVDEDPVLPPYLYAEDEQPNQGSTSLDAETAMSFATSITSNFSTPSQMSSKRNIDSPPSKSRPRKKHDSAKKRTHCSTPRLAAGSSVQCSTSSGSAVPLTASAE